MRTAENLQINRGQWPVVRLAQQAAKNFRRNKSGALASPSRIKASRHGYLHLQFTAFGQ
jgi:hypothetical protein